jgi:predicted ArsR family transcriptional regulator
VLAALRAASGPLTLQGLSEATGLHPNTLREHLDALQTAGRVRRARSAASRPGRPPLVYAAVADEPAPGRAEYAGLASALAATLHRTSEHARAAAIDAGTDWGRELARGRGGTTDRGGDEARHEVVDLLDDLGFAPQADDADAVVMLTRCPLLDTAVRYPDVVCGVHLGIVRGALEERGGDPDAAALFPFSDPGACRLHLSHGNIGGRR